MTLPPSDAAGPFDEESYVCDAMKKIAQRKPGKRVLHFDRQRCALVSRCNPIVCSDPHEKVEFQYPIGEADVF